jgi:gluconolactonase
MKPRVVARGLEFPEGPVCLEDGTVLVVELKSGAVARVDPVSGAVERVAKPGGSPNGAALGPDGYIYLCNSGGFEWREADGVSHPGHQPPDYSGGSIQRLDLDSGAIDDLYSACDGHRLSGPNDIVLDGHGGFYFTDIGKARERDSDTGGLYYAHCDGSSIEELVFPMNRPNGVGLSPSGDVVYVAETITSRIWHWQISSPGILTQPEISREALLYTANGFHFFDSLAVEEGGSICVATLLRPGITVISPSGGLVDFVELPAADPYITNICFGGPEMQTAYITSSGQGLLYEMSWPRRGHRLAGDFHRPNDQL